MVFPGATGTDITKNSGVKAPNISEDDMKKQMAMALSAEDAAELIVKGMEKDILLIYTGKDSKFMNRLYRLNPVFATKFIAKKMQSLLNS